MITKKKVVTTNKRPVEIESAIRIFADGSGSRPDGTGSAIAWMREDTGQTHVESIDNLTSNQAEYRAIISALEAAPQGSTLEVLADSQLVIYQILWTYRINDDGLFELRNRVISTVTARHLAAIFRWIPRSQNRADKLLQRRSKQILAREPDEAA
jgi:ribonuclease HI